MIRSVDLSILDLVVIFNTTLEYYKKNSSREFHKELKRLIGRSLTEEILKNDYFYLRTHDELSFALVRILNAFAFHLTTKNAKFWSDLSYEIMTKKTIVIPRRILLKHDQPHPHITVRK